MHLCIGQHGSVASSTKAMVEEVARLRARRPEIVERSFEAIRTLVANARASPSRPATGTRTRQAPRSGTGCSSEVALRLLHRDRAHVRDGLQRGRPRREADGGRRRQQRGGPRLVAGRRRCRHRGVEGRRLPAGSLACAAPDASLPPCVDGTRPCHEPLGLPGRPHRPPPLRTRRTTALAARSPAGIWGKQQRRGAGDSLAAGRASPR